MTLLLSALLSAQAATPPVQPAEYKQRRAALAAAVGAAHPGEQVLVVLRGGAKQPDFGTFPQDQDFFYLTGVAEPDVAMLLVVDDGKLTRDELLDNVMFYWATASAASSARLYWQSFRRGERNTVTVPTGVAVYPKEIVPPVRKWMEAGDFPNIQHWAEMGKGGHFAAFEQRAAFVDDLRTFCRAFR